MGPKQKGQKMNLQEFMGDQSLGSWADEMEDMPLPSDTRTGYGGERRNFGSMSGFGGERGGLERPGFGDRGFSDRGFAPREQLPLPTKPPFTAHLGNLPFDATEGDVEDFFAGCSVTNVRIVEDKFEHRPKGFGYVEFGTLEGLKKALDFNGTQLHGRNVRVSVAEPPKDRPESRDFSDWTRKGPLPDLPSNQQRRASERPSFRNLDSTSDAGSDWGDRKRTSAFEGDGKPRDFSNWERKGPLSPLPSGGPMREGGRGRGGDDLRERRPSPAWGEARGEPRSNEGSRAVSRSGRREFSDRPAPEKQSTAAELDNQWRARMRPDQAEKPATPTPDASTPSSPAAPAASAVRPKLNLQKRTVSEADPTAPAAASESKANPFGAARPVDSAARERQVEEKRQVAAHAKKEQGDKAREEQRAKEATAKAEKEKAGPTSPQENGKLPFRGKERRERSSVSAAKDTAKENGDTPQQGRNYEILRRTTNEEAEKGGNGEIAEDAETPANGNIVADKEVKPQSVVGDISEKPAESGDGPSGPTAQGLDEEGWNTVKGSQRGKNRRGTNSGARALAS